MRDISVLSLDYDGCGDYLLMPLRKAFLKISVILSGVLGAYLPFFLI